MPPLPVRVGPIETVPRSTIRGIGLTETRGSAQFELTVTVSGAVPTFDLKVRGFGYSTIDTVIAGQMDVAINQRTGETYLSWLNRPRTEVFSTQVL